MKKEKRFSALKLLIVILCITSVIVSAGINILFAGDKTPKLFDRYIYVVGEESPINEIRAGSALIARDLKKHESDPERSAASTGDIILCYPADDPAQLSLRCISFIAENEEGTSYYTMDSFHEDTTGSITMDKIVAICTGYNESLELGRFITFARQLKGIITLLGVPALLLIILLFASILASRNSDEDDEDEFGFYEYEEETSKAAKKKSDPLYEPSNEAPANPAFERRKMSIADNFKQKEVNPDSPYQKEKERTVQFKAQKGASLSNTTSFSGSGTAESSFAQRNPNSVSSPAPTAETLREEMLRKTAAAERTATYSKPAESTVSDNTGILTRDQVAELRGGAPVKPVETKVAAPAPKKSSSPDISDILGNTPRKPSKKPSDMSVDDLLKIIEEEKKKY
ncbi:MAG: hypothetical protein IKV85_00230 [Ruminococcus sp.]|nr:hypothetical protein [Ruminococcus sp.]